MTDSSTAAAALRVRHRQERRAVEGDRRDVRVGRRRVFDSDTDKEDAVGAAADRVRPAANSAGVAIRLWSDHLNSRRGNMRVRRG
jgi:hypothetical protein